MYKIIIDPAMALHLLRTTDDPLRTLWVFRYYDLDERSFPFYGQALVRLIDFIRALAAEKGARAKPKVNIIAHSMGGLIVREAIQRTYPDRDSQAADYINKIVTLGHAAPGDLVQLLKDWINIDAEEELEHFNPEFQDDPKKEACVHALRASTFRRNGCSPSSERTTAPTASPSRRALNRLFSVVRRGRAELQPQRRAGEADLRADPGLSANVRAQMPRRAGLAGHVARVVRDRARASSSGTSTRG